jgi:hypothetical protein
MIDLSDPRQVQAIKSNIHATFESAHGKETMAFLEQIGSWYPNIADPMDTNSIVARDANRRLIGTIKTIMACSADQIMAITQE